MKRLPQYQVRYTSYARPKGLVRSCCRWREWGRGAFVGGSGKTEKTRTAPFRCRTEMLLERNQLAQAFLGFLLAGGILWVIRTLSISCSRILRVGRRRILYVIDLCRGRLWIRGLWIRTLRIRRVGLCPRDRRIGSWCRPAAGAYDFASNFLSVCSASCRRALGVCRIGFRYHRNAPKRLIQVLDDGGSAFNDWLVHSGIADGCSFGHVRLFTKGHHELPYSAGFAAAVFLRLVLCNSFRRRRWNCGLQCR